MSHMKKLRMNNSNEQKIQQKTILDHSKMRKPMRELLSEIAE